MNPSKSPNPRIERLKEVHTILAAHHGVGEGEVLFLFMQQEQVAAQWVEHGCKTVAVDPFNEKDLGQANTGEVGVYCILSELSPQQEKTLSAAFNQHIEAQYADYKTKFKKLNKYVTGYEPNQVQTTAVFSSSDLWYDFQPLEAEGQLCNSALRIHPARLFFVDSALKALEDYHTCAWQQAHFDPNAKHAGKLEQIQFSHKNLEGQSRLLKAELLDFVHYFPAHPCENTLDTKVVALKDVEDIMLHQLGALDETTKQEAWHWYRTTCVEDMWGEDVEKLLAKEVTTNQASL
jgi:hypothetical protein